MGAMAEKVDTTWIVYALDGPAEPETLEAAIKRVVRHYGPLVDYPVAAAHELSPRRGILTVSDAEPVVGWPAFARSETSVLASAYPVAGWRRVVGDGVTLDAAPRS